MTIGKQVIIVGVLDKLGSTNLSQAKAFMQLGYGVIPINYRTLIQNYGMDFFNNILISTVKNFSPSLVLFAKCNGINPEIVKECSKHIKTWLWNPDPISTIQRCPEVVQHAKNSTFSSCTGGGVAEWFKEQGVSDCQHIFEGIDPDIYRPMEPIEKIKADISFIGSPTELRNEYRDFLKENNYDVKFYGTGYNSEVVNEAFAQICASSKYMLSINTQNDIPDYFSDRVFRYLGCGACVFHLDETGTMNKYFEDGKEIILFKDKEELLSKLKIVDADIAKKVAIDGRTHVLNKYTWISTIQKIVDIAEI